jgi:chemotaxis protein methyltransferase CheR/type IV pilus assembly protein PilK
MSIEATMAGENAVSSQQWSLQKATVMDDEQFTLWQTLLEDRTGILLTDQRKSFLETSLSIRMREIGCTSYDEYYGRLMTGLAGEIEWATLVDRLTVQETSFFRHTSSYDLVRDYCFNKLGGVEGKKQVDVWSVGCSTGEEPYSLAMLLDTILTEMGGGYYYGITATDISLPALSKGREGVYSSRKLANMENETKARYFEQTPDGRYRVCDRIRDRVCFARVNVLELETVPWRDMDIIFCQNLLIYFKRWRKRDIVTHLAERLRPGGLLVLGVGEVLDWNHPEMERVKYANTTAFMRRAGQ